MTKLAIDLAASSRPVLRFDPPLRGRIYDSIAETIGNTPLVRIPNIAREDGLEADVCLKLEFFNPMCSVKDRIGVNMILDMEERGAIPPGAAVIEPTSGHTGIGLAFMCASRGYRLILTMPAAVSIERQKILRFFGAEVVLTPTEHWVAGAVAKAKELLETIPGSVAPGQFVNPANPAVHRRTTSEEIGHDTAGQVDVLVAGVGTGGTLTGTADVLRSRRPGFKAIAVEPLNSPVLAGGEPGPHNLQGIGAGFVPDVLDRSQIDEIVHITNDEAYAASRRLARTEGIPVGITSGAAVAATLKVAKRPEMRGKVIVTIIPSFAERYLSTELFANE